MSCLCLSHQAVGQFGSSLMFVDICLQEFFWKSTGSWIPADYLTYHLIYFGQRDESGYQQIDYEVKDFSSCYNSISSAHV